ncbi:MAG: hypothetical protein WBM59_04270, partial [Sedimenticolaceae bacterium]
RESTEGVRLKDAPNSRAFLATNLTCPALSEVALIRSTKSLSISPMGGSVRVSYPKHMKKV